MNRPCVYIPPSLGSHSLNSLATVVLLSTCKHPQEVSSLIFYSVEIVNNKQGTSREREQTGHVERGRESERGRDREREREDGCLQGVSHNCFLIFNLSGRLYLFYRQWNSKCTKRLRQLDRENMAITNFNGTEEGGGGGGTKQLFFQRNTVKFKTDTKQRTGCCLQCFIMFHSVSQKSV